MKFSEREKAFEDLYMHDEKVVFKTLARRNMQAGLRTVREMGITGLLAEDNLMGKLRDDFAKSGKTISDAGLTGHVYGLNGAARKHFMESRNDTNSYA